MKKAYNEIEIVEESKDYTTIVTHKSSFRYKRLPVEIKIESNIFAIVISKLLGNLRDHRVTTYFDDILIANESKKERFVTVKMVLERIRNSGMTIFPKILNYVCEG